MNLLELQKLIIDFILRFCAGNTQVKYCYLGNNNLNLLKINRLNR